MSDATFAAMIERLRQAAHGHYTSHLASDIWAILGVVVDRDNEIARLKLELERVEAHRPIEGIASGPTPFGHIAAVEAEQQ